VLDVVADAVERVAGEVAPVAAVAEHAVEGDDHGRVEARVAGFPERAFVLVPAPEHGQLASLLGRGGAGEQGEDQASCYRHEGQALSGRHRHEWMVIDDKQ
jgi:hypothetical protein